MKLDEILSSVYPYESIPVDDGYEITFKDSKGDFVVVTFELWAGPESFEVSFTRDGKYNMTKGGDELRIFATVLKIMTDFLREHKPKFISFAASKEEESRVTFYKRLIRKFIPGTNYIEVTDDTDKIDHDVAPHWFRNRKNMFKTSDHMIVARKDMLKD